MQEEEFVRILQMLTGLGYSKREQSKLAGVIQEMMNKGNIADKSDFWHGIRGVVCDKQARHVLDTLYWVTRELELEPRVIEVNPYLAESFVVVLNNKALSREHLEMLLGRSDFEYVVLKVERGNLGLSFRLRSCV